MMRIYNAVRTMLMYILCAQKLFNGNTHNFNFQHFLIMNTIVNYTIT